MNACNPLFSVIVPVYNAEKYLEECLDSILNQDFFDFELIVVDDGSVDNSPLICESYKKKDARIRILHKKNEGVSVARADGVCLSKGEYVLFVDADDKLMPKCFSKIASVISSQKVDIVCWGMFWELKKKCKEIKIPLKSGFYSLHDIECYIYPILIHDERVKYFQPSIWSKAFKKELFAQNMLSNKAAVIGEDGACSIASIYNANSMYILNECFYFYRYNNDSATKSRKVYNWDCPKVIAEHIKNHVNINAFDFKQQLNRKIAHDVFTVAVSQFYSKRKYKQIVRDIDLNLKRTIYKEAIENCVFSKSIKAFFMKMTMKHRLFLLMKLFSLI